MNPHEFADKWKLSAKKVRQMIKADDWPSETDDPRTDAIRHLIAKGQPLTAAMLCELVESPAALLKLGRYAERASEQIDALGKAQAQAAPKEVTAYIADAARANGEAVAILIDWLKSIIPAHQVDHSFIAVRLLLGLAPSIRKFEIAKIPRALHQCRQHPDFAGWFAAVPHGTRNKTFYKKPKKQVAQFDL